MTGYRAGEVVSVEFPFTDLQGRKRRPGVVLAVHTNDVLLARVTTHEPRDAFDVPLMGWDAVGLPRSSTVPLLKVVSIDAKLVHHSIGILPEADRTRLAESVERLGLEIAGRLRR